MRTAFAVPDVCPACDGEGYRVVTAGPEEYEVVCEACSCGICGRPTSTAPTCARCDIVEDAAARRRADV